MRSNAAFMVYVEKVKYHDNSFSYTIGVSVFFVEFFILYNSII